MIFFVGGVIASEAKLQMSLPSPPLISTSHDTHGFVYLSSFLLALFFGHRIFIFLGMGIASEAKKLPFFDSIQDFFP